MGISYLGVQSLQENSQIYHSPSVKNLDLFTLSMKAMKKKSIPLLLI